MLSEYSISGFKGLKVESKDLKRLNLIGGMNNTGKTSLLEALFLSMDWGNADMLSRHLVFRGMAGYVSNPESAWYPAFANFDPKTKIQIATREVQGPRRQYTMQVIDEPWSKRQSAAALTNNTVRTQRRPGQKSLRVTVVAGSRTIYDATIGFTNGVPPFDLRPKISEEPAPAAAFIISRTRSSPHESATIFGDLDQKRQTEGIVEVVKKMFPEVISLSVLPIGNQSHLFADVRGLDRKVPINLLGDGLNQVIHIMLQVARAEGGFLLVDEIEAGFHYSLMPMVWRAVYDICKVFKVQLFATTHSYECVAAFASLQEIAKDDYTFTRLNKTEKGETSTTTYTAESLRNAIEGGWEVR
jgi:hypothetical protein